MTEHPPLVVVGGGNMARAIIDGALARGAIDAGLVGVVEPDDDRRAHFERRLGFAGARGSDGIAWLENVEGAPGAGQVLLAVKPQLLQKVAGEIGDQLKGRSRVVISILAGTPSPKIRTVLGSHLHIIRVMPNTPAQIGKGMTALCVGAGAEAGDEDLAVRLFESVGRVIRIDEAMMDVYTGVAGSGPAYVFYLTEAMIAAGEELGFSEEEAIEIARATVSGAAALMESSELSPAELRAAVTSRKGTTEAAIEVLDEAEVGRSIVDAIRAARDRGEELSKE